MSRAPGNGRTSAVLEAKETVETRFGDYVLHERLGKGGMAETFVATRDATFGASPRVCLKRILPGLCDDPSLRAMFLVEARLSARLHHGNVVRVTDFGELEGTVFLALELVHGADLRRLLTHALRTSSPLEASVVTEIAFALGCALDYAHAVADDGSVQGLVHRDISPSNVLVSTAGDVKLADFGIAKAVGQSVHTRTGTLKGKIPYMPPEYALEGRYDARSDLFALGVTLYETCALTRPFRGENDVATLEQIVAGHFVPLSARDDVRLPEALTRAIDRLLARDPRERFPDAGAFVDAIADVADSSCGRTRLAERTRRAHEAAASAAARKAREVAPKTAVLLEAKGAPAEEDVVPAAPGDVTRTRAPR